MRRTLPLLLAVGLSLLLAAPALASLTDRLVADFANDGQLDTCKYSDREVRQMRGLIANDVDAYQPDFRTAVDALIERRAGGVCKKQAEPGGGANAGAATGDGASAGAATGGGGATSSGSSGGSSAPAAGAAAAASAPGAAQPVPGPGQTPGPSPLIGTDSIPAAARSDREGGVPPVPLLALAALAALLALGGLVVGVARWTGWEPAWMGRARHATAEAGWRASSTWAEFTDFVRFGR